MQNICREGPRRLASTLLEPPPSPFPALLLASPPSSPPPPRPQPCDPLLGWAGPGRSLRGWGAGRQSLRDQGKMEQCSGRKRRGAPKNTIGNPHVLTFKGARPRLWSCLSPWLPNAKAAYLQPDPSELLGMPSPTTKDLQEPECLDFNYLVLTGSSNWRILQAVLFIRITPYCNNTFFFLSQ